AAKIAHLQDVIVVELRHRGGLATEPLERSVVRRELSVQDLDRDAFAQRRVLAAIDRARAALPDFLDEQIAIRDHLAEQRIATTGGRDWGAALRTKARVLWRGRAALRAVPHDCVILAHIRSVRPW